MSLWTFRRVVSMLIALVFLAGMQLVAAPASAAAFTATTVAGQSNPSGCKACGDQNMTAGECSAVCSAFQSLGGHVASLMPPFDAQSWQWLSESIRTTAVQPDLSPPRS